MVNMAMIFSVCFPVYVKVIFTLYNFKVMGMLNMGKYTYLYTLFIILLNLFLSFSRRNRRKVSSVCL